MQKLRSIAIALAVLVSGACVNSGGKSAGTGDSKPAQETPNGPDGKELLSLLQGNWQSTTDATYQLIISNDTIQHVNEGKLSAANTLEIDVNCQNVSCKTDSIDTSDGWCFLEKGQVDIQCNLIIKADTAQLEYRALGAAGGSLVFRKKD